MPRLFLGLAMPPSAAAALQSLQSKVMAELVHLGASLRRIRPEHLHLTVAFVGDISEARCGELIARGSRLAVNLPQAWSLSGVGGFARDGMVHSVFADVGAGKEALLTLMARSDELLAELGIPVDRGSRQPHVTLLRTGDLAESEAWKCCAGQHRAWSFGPMVGARLCLYRSDPKPGGSCYTVLQDF